MCAKCDSEQSSGPASPFVGHAGQGGCSLGSGGIAPYEPPRSSNVADSLRRAGVDLQLVEPSVQFRASQHVLQSAFDFDQQAGAVDRAVVTYFPIIRVAMSIGRCCWAARPVRLGILKAIPEYPSRNCVLPTERSAESSNIPCTLKFTSIRLAQ